MRARKARDLMNGCGVRIHIPHVLAVNVNFEALGELMDPLDNDSLGSIASVQERRDNRDSGFVRDFGGSGVLVCHVELGCGAGKELAWGSWSEQFTIGDSWEVAKISGKRKRIPIKSHKYAFEM